MNNFDVNFSTKEILQLVDNLPDVPESPVEFDFYEDRIDVGLCSSYRLDFKDQFIHSYRGVASEGTEFPLHTHNELRIYIVLQGELIIIIEGRTIGCRSGERPVYVPAGAEHSMTFVEHTHFVELVVR